MFACIHVSEHGHVTILQRLAGLRCGVMSGFGLPAFSASATPIHANIAGPPCSATRATHSLVHPDSFRTCPRPPLSTLAAIGYLGFGWGWKAAGRDHMAFVAGLVCRAGLSFA
jgi:hypothetical protein